jgi:hypothetical protein
MLHIYSYDVDLLKMSRVMLEICRRMKINITHNFMTMVTGHGNIRSYLHRFKILDTPTCSCGTKGPNNRSLVI